MLKQYRPNIERQKWLYSMMKSREIMRRRCLDGTTYFSKPWLNLKEETSWEAFQVYEKMREVENDYLQGIPFVKPDQAIRMLQYFVTPKVAASAMRHVDSRVREVGRQYLQELVDSGDPTSAKLLQPSIPAAFEPQVTL